MDYETILPFALAFFSLLSFQLGGMIRSRVHTIMPWKDPATLILMTIAFSPVIGEYTGHHFLDPDNIWYLSFLLSFVSCYTLAYLRGEFEMMYVAVNVISSKKYPNGATIVKPIVYYETEEGLFLQEQTLKEILKTVFLGIRTPLDFPMERIQRTMPMFIQKVFFPVISLDAVNVVEEVVKEEVITKFRFMKFKVRSYSYTAAPHCTDPSQIWMVNKANHETLLFQLCRKENELLSARQEAMTGRIAMAADIVTNLVSEHTPEADVFTDLEERFRPIPARKMKVGKEQENPEVKHKSIIRTRRNGSLVEEEPMEEQTWEEE